MNTLLARQAYRRGKRPPLFGYVERVPGLIDGVDLDMSPCCQPRATWRNLRVYEVQVSRELRPLCFRSYGQEGHAKKATHLLCCLLKFFAIILAFSPPRPLSQHPTHKSGRSLKSTQHGACGIPSLLTSPGSTTPNLTNTLAWPHISTFPERIAVSQPLFWPRKQASAGASSPSKKHAEYTARNPANWQIH